MHRPAGSSSLSDWLVPSTRCNVLVEAGLNFGRRYSGIKDTRIDPTPVFDGSSDPLGAAGLKFGCMVCTTHLFVLSPIRLLTTFGAVRRLVAPATGFQLLVIFSAFLAVFLVNQMDHILLGEGGSNAIS